MFKSLHVIGNPSLSPDTLILLNPRYKIEQHADGVREVLDLEATAKASIVVRNIGKEHPCSSAQHGDGG